MAVRKNGDRWVVEFMSRGIRIFRRLPPGRTKADAQQLESRLRNQIFDAVDLGKLPDPLLGKVIDEWLETKRGSKAEKQTGSHARSVCAIAADARYSALTEVADKVRGRVALSPATINRRLCILKAVAKYAYQKGYAQENLSGKIQLLPEHNSRSTFLSQAQVDALVRNRLDQKDVDGAAFIAIAAYTGLRQGEILALRKEDVLAESVVVRDSKNGTRRLVPIVPAVKPHLIRIPFTSHKRTHYKAFEAAREALGMRGLRYHDLRHTTASMLINSGADLYTVGKVLGHKSQQTTARYAHLSLERQREALERAFPSKLHQGAKKKARK